MMNIEMARDYLKRAKRCLQEAESAFKDDDAPMAIRRAQEAKNKLPLELTRDLDELASLIAELASIRGPAFYGYEREGIPAYKAFNIQYANEILSKVKKHFTAIENTITKSLKNSI